MFESIISTLENIVWTYGIPVGDGQWIPWVVILLLGAGLYLTLRLSFIQIRRFGHGVGVTSGKYDDPDEPGDVPHFQALTTALSATVGIGNIAGVALAIHFGGPGALFWMWVTAFLGMATKYTEVTLAQHYRTEEHVTEGGVKRSMIGTVSGGPMYYIERGLGWKPMAIFFAFMLMITSFLTGNAVQANTVTDVMIGTFGWPKWITGLGLVLIIGLVILGGITRIGRVTGVVAPVMAIIYFIGGLLILIFNAAEVPGAIALVFSEAFNPTSGVAGAGAGVFLLTMMYGVRRGLFSNESGQGSAPIAHSAAKTDEPVSEGAVALLEPFIDTIVICSITGLAIIVTGVWAATFPTTLDLDGDPVSYRIEGTGGIFSSADPPEQIEIRDGEPTGAVGYAAFAWNEAIVDSFFVNGEMTETFSGVLYPMRGAAIGEDGETYDVLYGNAAETGAPLTQAAFQQGLRPLGDWGGYIVIMSVLLFAISTAISWSYYGNRCANYLFGHGAILPYNVAFLIMNFVGAVATLTTIWTIGDIALGIVIVPNLIALIWLSGKVKNMTNSYFEREPWHENAEVHKRWKDEQKGRTST